MKRILLLLALLVAGFWLFVELTWNKHYDAPYPDIQASTDPDVIARGRYLAYGPAHCAACHMPMDRLMAVEEGAMDPLSGGWELTIPPGTFRAPNITPHATGIADRTDGELARALRYSVGHDGRGLLPFMPFQGLSDEDLTAVISFLRSQPPVDHALPAHEYTFLGKMVKALGLIPPDQPKEPPPARVQRDSTAAYGRYLANFVADCVGCHTDRDMNTGAYIGTPFAGGFYMEPDTFSQGWSFVTPNLTPDPETGHIAAWDEATFIKRFKTGRLQPGSHMPWGFVSRMDTLELKAIYRYLRSLPPTNKHIAQIVFKPGEKPAR
ncbi:MAG: cytochrome c [Flavobacteriales bacterium]|nr:cytochrome c [Flavobacteriales bacterium]